MGAHCLSWFTQAAKMPNAESEAEVTLMLELIEESMADRLEEVEWLDTPTFEAAETKLEIVINYVGYIARNESYNFVLSSTNLSENLEIISASKRSSKISKIGLPASLEASLRLTRTKSTRLMPDF